MRDFFETLKGGTILSLGSLVGQITSFAVLPLTMTNFEPHEFGTNGILVLLTMLLSSLMTFSSEVLVFQKKSITHSFKIVIGNIVRCSIIFVTLGPLSLLAMQYEEIKYYALIFPAAALQAMYLNIYYINNKLGKYHLMTIMVIINSLFTSVAPNVFEQYGIFSLFVSYMLGLIIAILFNFKVVLFCIKKYEFRTKLNKKGLYIFLQSGLDHFNITFSAVILTKLYGADFFGLYSLATRILNAPLSFISNSLSQIYAKKISETRSVITFKHFFYLVLILSLLSYISINVIFYFFNYLLPDSWGSISNFILILSVGYSVRFITSSFSHTPIIFNKLKLNAKIAFIGTITSLLVFMISGFLGVDSSMMLVALSIYFVVYYLSCLLWFKSLVICYDK